MKYRVLLIDDDFPVIKYLEQLLPWEELGFQIVGSSISSIKALQLFKEKKPHLVITDIGLPQMDGIELASEMRKLNDEVRVLFLTCHEDFHFARRAIRMNADDYLIKDELTADKLRRSIEKSKAYLDQWQRSLKQIDHKVDIHRHKEMFKSTFLSNILSGDTSETVRQLGRRIGIEWEKSSFILIEGKINYVTFLHYYGMKDIQAIQYAYYNIAENLAADDERISIILKDHDRIMVVFNFDENIAINVHEQLEHFLNKVRQAVKKFLKIDVYFACSEQFEGIQKMGKIMDELASAMKRVYYQCDQVGIIFPCHSGNVDWIDMPHLAHQAKDECMNAFKDGDISTLLGLFQKLGNESKVNNIDPARWISESSQLLRILEFEAGFQHESESIHQMIQQSGCLNETIGLIEYRLHQLMKTELLPYAMSSKEPTLQAIDHYIRNHLSDNITSLTMAKHLHLNPSYFSRFFKKKSGVNFTDYVHRMKMEHAARMMLNSDDTVEIIAEKLGYSDRTYFSKVFKKYHGISPSKYRR